MASSPTRILIGVNESSIKSYPYASISSRTAFDWTVEKIIRDNVTGFKILFVHVQIPDEDVHTSTRHQIVSRKDAPLSILEEKSLAQQNSDPLNSAQINPLYAGELGFDDMDSIYASPEDFARVNMRDKARGLHLLEYFVGRCHQLGIACEAWIRKGDPKEVLCSEVKRVHPDLLVVGSRGLGPFHRVFVGTVSEFCVKHAECPVISIKRKAEEAPQDPVDD